MKNNYNKKLKNILYCSLVFYSTLQGASLEEVLKKNIYRNPQVQVSKANYQSSLHDLEKVKAGNKPTLDISGEVGRERTQIDYSFEGNRELNENQARLVGRYNLFKGYKITHELKEKKFAIEVAKNQVLDKINSSASLIIQVYVEVLRKKALLGVSEENYVNHLETLEKVELRLRAGDGYESNYRQTKARVKLAQANKLLAKRAYVNSKINYKRFMKDFPDVSSMRMPFVMLSIDESKVEDFVQKAYRRNYKMEIQKSKIDVSKSLYAQEKSRDYPSLDLEISQAWSNNVHGFEGADNSQKLALVLNYNLYNGGADQAAKLSALKRSEMQEGNLDDIKLDVEEQIRISLMKYLLLESQLEIIKEQLEHLLGTTELYTLEYQNSKRTIIDLLNIKQEYNYAQSQKINAKFDKLLAYYQFKSAMGELLEEFGLSDILELP
jgi:adhesin transport system outer membrane protein